MSKGKEPKKTSHKIYNANTIKELGQKTGFLKELDAFLKDEGCTETNILNVYPKQQIISLDNVRKTNFRQQGVKSCDIGFMTNNHKFQLTECKYRVNNPVNLKDKDIAKKVMDSKEFMKSFNVTNFAIPTIFLFNSNSVNI